MITNIAAEYGSGTASGYHAGTYGTATYSTPAGNGSSHSFSANGWTNNPGDYFQFATSTLGFTNIFITFDQVSSGTGPGQFYVAYSTDGVNFTQYGSTYTVLSSPSWSSGTMQTAETNYVDLSSITALANQPVIYIRLVDASNVSANGGTVGTGGTCRVDNFTIVGTIAGPAQIVKQPVSTTNYFGDNAFFTVVAGGDAPITYQWYYFTNGAASTNLLMDGSSGYGAGTITGSSELLLNLTFVNTNQAGNYFFVVSNYSGSVTSSVVQLTVNMRPLIPATISSLHLLHDANYALTDTTNLYVVEGIVTTPANLVSPDPASSFFVQDGTGGMDVFFRGGFPFPAAGDHVRITAPLLQFNGLLEAAPVNGNPAHNIEILDSGNPLPAPQLFDFTTLPTPATVEESLEGRYLYVTNVYIGVTNADPHLVGGETIFMTNLTGQVYRMTMANNPILGPIGYPLPGSFATSVTGVLSQSQTSGSVLTNGYSLVLADFSQIQIGTPPVAPIPLTFEASGNSLTLSWTDSSFSLQWSTNVAGPYATVAGATSPLMTNTTDNAQMFFRLIH